MYLQVPLLRLMPINQFCCEVMELGSFYINNLPTINLLNIFSYLETCSDTQLEFGQFLRFANSEGVNIRCEHDWSGKLEPLCKTNGC